jgi:hypothetical protein
MTNKYNLNIKDYTKCYYQHNREKLLNYSKNYYTYKKNDGNISESDLSEKMKTFILHYKKQGTNIEEIDTKITIEKKNIVISFN